MYSKPIATVIIVITVALLIVSCTTRYYATEKTYLEQNHEVINLSNETPIALLDRFTDAEVFFIGEVHGVSENYQFTLKLLKELNNKYGLKNFIAEVGYSSAWMLNSYIESGDEQLLETVLEGSTGTFFGTQDSEWFLRSLRVYNLSVPDTQRIKYDGLDLDHQPASAFHHLADISSRTEAAAPELLQNFIDRITDLSFSGAISKQDLYNNWIKAIWADYNKNRTTYISWCGIEAAAELELTLRNLHDGLYWYVIEECKTNRDNYIFRNFEDIYCTGEKYIGLWGNMHTPMTAADPEEPYIASMLKTEGYGVSSVLILYFDSEGYNPSNPALPYVVEYNPLTTARLRAVYQSPAVFFDLHAEGSPFLNSDNLNFSGSYSNAACDYYQGCILLSGATASTVAGR